MMKIETIQVRVKLNCRGFWVGRALTQCRFKVGPASTTPVQYWFYIIGFNVSCWAGSPSKQRDSKYHPLYYYIYKTAAWSNSLVILYVGHYLLDHEIKRFWSWFSDFHKNGGHFKLLETLWKRYLMNRWSEWLVYRHLPPWPLNEEVFVTVQWFS